MGLAFIDEDLTSIHSELKRAIHQLSIRGLKLSTRWIAELLVAFDHPISNSSHTTTSSSLDDTYLLAKSYFDCNEFQRAAHTLESHLHSTSHYFLWGYSLYLYGEETKQMNDNENAINPELKRLHDDLTPRYEAHQLDGFGLYLYGIILKNLRMQDIAKSVFIESIQIYPWNWSAWLDLASCCSDKDDIDSFFVSNPCEWMFTFFKAHFMTEHQQDQLALSHLEELSLLFPKSVYITAQRGLVHYNLRDFDSAESEFQLIRTKDPYRLESLDVYSNVFYVKDCKAELSRLAHTCMKINKFRPETCCVVGNYYSLKAKHDRAVVYFQRALKLDPHYLSAWTLMGHEFVELKNTGAAIDAYRHAVDISPNDYRAWYGLGQTYEILQMEYYALYYYRKAAALRPFDARMWCAMAQCYRRLDRREDAILCFERAISNKDHEGIAAVQLGALYRDSGKHDDAAYYFEMHLNQRANCQRQETVDAIMFMTLYYKGKGQYSKAAEFCNRLLDRSGPEKDEAKAILRELRNLDQRVSS